MESLKKAKDSIDMFLKIADFLRESKDTLPKLGDLPSHIAGLEQAKKLLNDEVTVLNAQRNTLKTEIESEKASLIKQLNDRARDLDDKSAILVQEREQIKSEMVRIQNRDKELTDMIKMYEKSTRESYEAKQKFEEKLKAIGEAVK